MIMMNQPVIDDYLRFMPIELSIATVAGEGAAMHVKTQITARPCMLGTIQHFLGEEVTASV